MINVFKYTKDKDDETGISSYTITKIVNDITIIKFKRVDLDYKIEIKKRKIGDNIYIFADFTTFIGDDDINHIKNSIRFYSNRVKITHRLINNLELLLVYPIFINGKAKRMIKKTMIQDLPLINIKDNKYNYNQFISYVEKYTCKKSRFVSNIINELRESMHTLETKIDDNFRLYNRIINNIYELLNDDKFIEFIKNKLDYNITNLYTNIDNDHLNDKLKNILEKIIDEKCE